MKQRNTLQFDNYNADICSIFKRWTHVCVKIDYICIYNIHAFILLSYSCIQCHIATLCITYIMHNVVYEYKGADLIIMDLRIILYSAFILHTECTKDNFTG